MYLAYDLETFPNAFTCAFVNDEIRKVTIGIRETLDFVQYLYDNRFKMIGFNNMRFDYPVLHKIMTGELTNEMQIYMYASKIIREGHWGIHWREQFIEQIDLYLINHFDNKAKVTSLKALEFYMRMESLEDLPYKPGSYIDDINILAAYNLHDGDATWQFAGECMTAIKFREELGRDWMNYNDGKIGKQTFLRRLAVTGKQTIRPFTDLKDVILPITDHLRPEFKAVRDSMGVITSTKGLKWSAEIDGFKYDFGLGGIHGSQQGSFYGDITDVDVASYYPNLAIANRFYPEHLNESFCDIYEEVFNERKKYPKSDVRNGMLKLALNSVYGDSNNQYSDFFDSKYTMSITINGQLLLCLLAQLLIAGGCKVIQINTDGITVQGGEDIAERCAFWEEQTGLTLESVRYREMHCRDVNNYVAVYEDGKTKLKGAYAYKRAFHQNHSMLVVPKAVERHILTGEPLKDIIENWPDPWDFLILGKVNRNCQLLHGSEEIQRISRYYVAQSGDSLTKVMPPLVHAWYRYPTPERILKAWGDVIDEGNGNILVRTAAARRRLGEPLESIVLEGAPRRSVVSGGLPVVVCNKFNGNIKNIDYSFYLQEALKLVDCFDLPIRGD